MRWEYDIVHNAGRNFATVVKFLDEYGAEGWELVAVAGDTLYLKRPLPWVTKGPQ